MDSRASLMYMTKKLYENFVKGMLWNVRIISAHCLLIAMGCRLSRKHCITTFINVECSYPTFINVVLYL